VIGDAMPTRAVPEDVYPPPGVVDAVTGHVVPAPDSVAASGAADLEPETEPDSVREGAQVNNRATTEDDDTGGGGGGDDDF
jgi:hypothetical protein